ncbi:MAG: molybdopterin converting factor [Chloroflexaceae bacterium]|nr:molybdopterin converting factor [Chloroflexaceae bacterium]
MTDIITVTIRLFASHRDMVGQSELSWTLPVGNTVAQLWAALVAAYPALQPSTASLMYAVNHELCHPTTVLADHDEVAFLPPVSGGNAGDEPPFFCVTTDPLDQAALVRLVQTPHDGAIVTFAGVVRDHAEERPTIGLTYEAYTTMAESMMAQLAAEAHARWSVGKIAMYHRTGRLTIGETAVLVVVAAVHRQAAFAAAAYLMDRIKEVVPIWKQEHWADGQATWQH